MTKKDDSTLDKLLEAAKAEFSQRGFARTKVSDITKRAGLGKGTFYLYFGSKEEIVRSMVDKMLRQVNNILDEFTQRVHTHKYPFEDMIKELIELTLHEFYEVKEVIIISKYSGLELGEEMMTMKSRNMAAMKEKIVAIVRSAIEEGYLRTMDVESVVDILMLLCLNYSEEIIFKEKKARISHHAKILEDFIMKGMENK